MNKSAYWWIRLNIACVFGGSIAFFTKDIIEASFLIFIFIIYGAACEVDGKQKTDN